MLGKMPIGKAVSIHTPTKGVTQQNEWSLNKLMVSIHTPTKGVTRLLVFTMSCHRFQSTHPRRV